MDWNSDGEPDIISGDRYGYLNVFTYNQTDSTMTAHYKMLLVNGDTLDVGYNSEPSVFDWNGDGKKDLLMGVDARHIRVYINQTSDTWPMFQEYDTVRAGGQVVNFYRVNPYMFDLNQDGLLDLICGEQNGYVHYFENTGTDTAPVFAAGETLKLNDGTPVRWTRNNYYYGSRCGFGDWNNDSVPDFLMSTYEGQIELYLGLAPVGVEERPARPISGVRVSPVPGGPPVQFAMTLTRTATLAVLDNSGRVVRTLGTLDPGNSSVAWNGLDDDGRRVPAGVYFARLAAGSEARTTRVVLAR